MNENLLASMDETKSSQSGTISSCVLESHDGDVASDSDEHPDSIVYCDEFIQNTPPSPNESSRVMPDEVFRTKQLFYALLDNGRLDAKLSQPRPLNFCPMDSETNDQIYWPMNMEVVPERVIHINKPPTNRELIYETGGEQPNAVIPDDGNTVYHYKPKLGKYILASIPKHASPKKHWTSVPSILGLIDIALSLFLVKIKLANYRRQGLSPIYLSYSVDGSCVKQVHTHHCRFRVAKSDGCHPTLRNPMSNIDNLRFESRFESGNLEKVVSITPNDYQLYLHPDLYTKKYTQWFYFRVSNMKVGVKYRFTIVNFYKSKSLFSSGMRPLMYSEKLSQSSDIGWHRTGEDIQYYRTGCYPYTYTQLRTYLNKIERNPAKRQICKQEVLCHTLAGNVVPLITISEPHEINEECLPDDPINEEMNGTMTKRCVIITARVHPGEPQSSWMIQGLIDFLISDVTDAQMLRSNFVFKIVPMLNPDGVIVGNYRCSLTGCDLNRRYNSNSKDFFPTIWHTKEMIFNTMKNRDVLIYCDFHGHSRKQKMFVYGCENSAIETTGRIFPAMLSKNAPDLFDYGKCRFVVQKEKEGTGRILMWRAGILDSYTLEATFCGSDAGYHFKTDDYSEMGRKFCETLLDYGDPDPRKSSYLMTEIRAVKYRRMRTNRCETFDPSDAASRLTSPEESSDTGSDSSNCDELPEEYTEVIRKTGKKRIRRRPRPKQITVSKKLDVNTNRRELRNDPSHLRQNDTYSELNSQCFHPGRPSPTPSYLTPESRCSKSVLGNHGDSKQQSEHENPGSYGSPIHARRVSSCRMNRCMTSKEHSHGVPYELQDSCGSAKLHGDITPRRRRESANKTCPKRTHLLSNHPPSPWSLQPCIDNQHLMLVGQSLSQPSVLTKNAHSERLDRQIHSRSINYTTTSTSRL